MILTRAAFYAGYKASGKAYYTHEIEEAWKRYVSLSTGIAQDNELDRHSSLAKVIRCMFEAWSELSDNDFMYQDDDLNTNISREEVEVIINLLSHSNMSAVEANDLWNEL